MSGRRLFDPAKAATGRDLNERIARWAKLNGHAMDTIAYYCECDDLGCFRRICLTGIQYKRLRAVPERAAVVPGHEPADIEGVVERYHDHLVVTRKRPVRPAADRVNGPPTTASGRWR